MITVIHGTDTASSRKYFLDQKSYYADSLLIDGQNISITDLVQYFEGGELFTVHKKFFIEQLIGKKKKSKELDALIDYINATGNDNEIYIWEDKELTPAVIKYFKGATVKPFKLSQTLFLFLENIKPRNGKMLISLFHQTLENNDTEMVFFMIARQIRTLLALNEPGTEQIDEVKRMAPWLIGKTNSQAKLFKKEELISINNKLFEIEKQLKTGSLSSNLVSTIDFLLLEI